AHFTVTGVQGHSAYPALYVNPLSALVRLMDRLASHRLDEGNAHFDPSTLAIVTIDTGNPATNVVPARATATVNIRFNDSHSGAALTGWMQAEADTVAAEFGVNIAMAVKISGESFLTPPGALADLVSAAVAAETGVTPALSTSGGTSDARFVKDHCPVVEFGLVGHRMHQVDENVAVADLEKLTDIYRSVLALYFERMAA